MIVSFIIMAVQVVVLAVFIRFDPVGPFIFSGSRIRDGTMGRINCFMVVMAGLPMAPAALLVLTALPEKTAAAVPEDTPYDMLMLLTTLTFAIPDGVAELVGSFLGSLEFKVYGFGDINKKTMEGVVACWLTAFAVCEMVMRCASPESGGLGWLDSLVISSAEGLAVILATVITVVETTAPRGTDDSAGQLAVAVTLLALWRW